MVIKSDSLVPSLCVEGASLEFSHCFSKKLKKSLFVMRLSNASESCVCDKSI